MYTYQPVFPSTYRKICRTYLLAEEVVNLHHLHPIASDINVLKTLQARTLPDLEEDVEDKSIGTTTYTAKNSRASFEAVMLAYSTRRICQRPEAAVTLELRLAMQDRQDELNRIFRILRLFRSS